MLDNLLELLSTTDGRASRRHWWAAMATYFALALSVILTIGFESGALTFFAYVVYGMAAIGCFIVSIRRLHDIDLSGFWVLLYFVPVVGHVALLVLLGMVSGSRGKNTYGEAFRLRRQPVSHSISDLYTPAADNASATSNAAIPSDETP